MNIIELDGVSKSYPIYESPNHRLRELLTLQRRSFHRDFWALRDVSFSIGRGETFCVIGENGSGKSTLLQLVAGILKPSAGTISVSGRVSALLELGAGFNPEFTGRDNVYLNGTILGLSRQEIDRVYPQILSFAEIGDFIHQPVKTYSSGMMVRLAFAVAIHVQPEILLVDEALAVGDIYFRQRCMRQVHELRARGVTVLFVSHALSDVKALGSRTLWLEGGEVRDLGRTDLVVSRYLAAMMQKDAFYQRHQCSRPGVEPRENVVAPDVITTIPNIDHRHGDGRAEILGIAVTDPSGALLPILQPHDSIVVRISIRAKSPISRPNVGFLIRNHLGVDFAGTNVVRESFHLPPMHAGDIYTVDFSFDLPELYPGSFSFSPAVADGDLIEYTTCDWIDNAITLQMGPGAGPVYGYLHLPAKIDFNRSLAHSKPAAEDSVD